MDSPLVGVESTRQVDILRHQLESVRCSLDEGGNAAFLAALMIEWHACYYPQAFAPIVRECQALVEDAKSRPSYWGCSRTLIAPIELALLVTRNGDPLCQLPPGFEIMLWSGDTQVRQRIRTCLYWAAPFIEAATLFDAYVLSWQSGRLHEQLAFVIGLCRGGFEELWRLRDHLPPGDQILDDAIEGHAVAVTVANPFTTEVVELTSYMFRQSIRITEGLEYWCDGDEERSPYDERQIAILCSIDGGCPLVLTTRVNYANVEEYHRMCDDVTPLVAAQIVGSSWRRLVRYSDGSCGVEKYDCEYGWWMRSSMTAGEFITRVGGAAV